jgi:hypothetical protein
MADIRIKDLATTATTTASDDFMAVDGSTNGTRKMNAAAPAFLTSVTTPSLTSPAATNLTLAAGGTNQSVILTPSGTGGVGIGETSPAHTLSLKTATSTYIKLAADFGDGYIGMETADDTFRFVTGQATPIVFFTNNTARATIGATGTVSISSSTAGSSGAGALVVTGGLSAGNNGNASYFGGAVSVTVSSGPTLQINNVGTDSPYIGFYRGGTIRSALQLFTDNDFRFYSSNLSTYAAISAGAATFAGAVTVAGTVIHTLSATPASASATGTVGTMSWDASYIYICTATNTWKRVAIATW